MISSIALGTVQFGKNYGVANNLGRVSQSEVSEILRTAAEAGISTLDTAISYGESEVVLGSCGVNDWEIFTKLPIIPKDCSNIESFVIHEIEGSLSRLQVKSVQGLLLHRPEQLLGGDAGEIVRALRLIKSMGYVKKIGISIYSVNRLDELLGLDVCDLIQAPLNILDRQLVESGWSKRIKNLGLELHIRSVFLQGLLLMPLKKRPQKFNRWLHIWNQWEYWLDEAGLTPFQACLAYVFSVKDVDRIIFGVDSLKQLKELLNAVNTGLPNLGVLPEWPNLPDVELINPSYWDKL